MDALSTVTSSRSKRTTEYVRDSIALYWGSLISLGVVSSINVFSPDVRQRVITFVEDLIDRLLPSVNENDSPRCNTGAMNEIQRLRRLFSTLVLRLRLHGGLYAVVLKTCALQYVEDARLSCKVETFSPHLNCFKELIITKATDRFRNVSRRISDSTESIKKVRSDVTHYIAQIRIQLMEYVSSLNAFTWPFSSIHDINVPCIPITKSQGELETQCIVRAVSREQSMRVDEKQTGVDDCQKIGSCPDSFSTSSTESCCTPNNLDEANSTT